MSSAQRRIGCESSHPLHEAVHHTLFSGLVERDGEFVAVDGGDVAVAELLVKHALADREIGDGSSNLATSSPSMVRGSGARAVVDGRD